MMGAMDARNMQINLAVNEYPHTVAFCWISSTYTALSKEIMLFQRTLYVPYPCIEQYLYNKSTNAHQYNMFIIYYSTNFGRFSKNYQGVIQEYKQYTNIAQNV